MTQPFFSIIIPTFNSGKTLLACLESIMGQSFQNFEILIMDGLSTDKTLFIVKKYEAANPNIRWFSEKDKGIYDAMNKGIKLAKGEWIYFLGSDDKLYNSEVLNNITQELRRIANIDVFYGNVYSSRFNGIYDGEFSYEKIYKQNLCHQSIFFSKTVFDEVGYFDLKYKGHADWDHNLKWFLSKKINKSFIDLVIAEYADGGFSSLGVDEIFLSDKEFKYLLSGRRILDYKTKIFILKSELKKAIKSKEVRRSIFILSRIPYILC